MMAVGVAGSAPAFWALRGAIRLGAGGMTIVAGSGAFCFLGQFAAAFAEGFEGIAGAAQCVGAMVVGEEEDDVWAFCSFGGFGKVGAASGERYG